MLQLATLTRLLSGSSMSLPGLAAEHLSSCLMSRTCPAYGVNIAMDRTSPAAASSAATLQKRCQLAHSQVPEKPRAAKAEPELGGASRAGQMLESRVTVCGNAVLRPSPHRAAQYVRRRVHTLL